MDYFAWWSRIFSNFDSFFLLLGPPIIYYDLHRFKSSRAMRRERKERCWRLFERRIVALLKAWTQYLHLAPNSYLFFYHNVENEIHQGSRETNKTENQIGISTSRFLLGFDRSIWQVCHSLGHDPMLVLAWRPLWTTRLWMARKFVFPREQERWFPSHRRFCLDRLQETQISDLRILCPMMYVPIRLILMD